MTRVADAIRPGASSTSFAGVLQTAGSLEDLFPDVDCLHEPLGSTVIVQIKAAKAMSEGGIALPAEVRDTVAANTQVAKVIALGPLAFRNRNTGEPWREGAWVRVSQYVRVPRFGSDKWEVRHEPNTPRECIVEFRMLNDLELKACVTDPLRVIAYV